MKEGPMPLKAFLEKEEVGPVLQKSCTISLFSQITHFGLGEARKCYWKRRKLPAISSVLRMFCKGCVPQPSESFKVGIV